MSTASGISTSGFGGEDVSSEDGGRMSGKDRKTDKNGYDDEPMRLEDGSEMPQAYATITPRNWTQTMT